MSDAREPGSIQNLEADFSAIVMPGLDLAFDDVQHVELEGTTLRGADATREIPVCNPGAFVVLKALACDNREKDKDPYDLFYMLRNYGDGPEDVASDLQPYLDASEQRAYEAVEILERDFDEPHAVGPMAVSHFLYGERHADLEADVVAFVDALLRALEW
jgi:hypothetical protein